MDLSHVYKGSLIKVIGDLRKLVPRGFLGSVEMSRRAV